MRLVVADASVVIKWLLPARNEERDGEQALTADERYYAKASRRGRVVLLRDFS